MNALFIDDEEASINPAMDIFKENNIECKYLSFNEFNSSSNIFKPDIVILDMMNGGAANDPTGNCGNEIYSQIWEKSFCPIIIYSANPELNNGIEHPFIKKVTKGKGSEADVWEEAKKFIPYLQQQQNLKDEFNTVLNKTLRDTAPTILDLLSNDNEEIFLRISRRRVAAEMDNGIEHQTPLKPWEQYIYPAIGENWLQGDIIKNIAEQTFFLVLTPSCDLVKRTNGIKAKTILCAKCNLYDSRLINCYLRTKKSSTCLMCDSKYCVDNINQCNDQRDKDFQNEKVNELTSLLNSGIVGKFYVLPKLGKIIPNLLADLKNFHLITKNEMNEYERVASIDSPFREQLSWVFVSIAGRPGMPDRDFSSWASDNI